MGLLVSTARWSFEPPRRRPEFWSCPGHVKTLRIGRAEAVNVVFSALRGTQDDVPVRKQATLKVCGTVESAGELDTSFPVRGSSRRISSTRHHEGPSEPGAAVLKISRAAQPPPSVVLTPPARIARQLTTGENLPALRRSLASAG